MPRWRDGSMHSISEEQHLANEAAAKAKAQGQINQAKADFVAAGKAGTLGRDSTGPLANGLPPFQPPAPVGSTPVGAAPVRTPFQYTPDSGYNDAIALNKKNYDDTITNLGVDETKTKYDYGFDDPTNPNSRISELKRLFLAQKGAADVSLNSRGLGLSGAMLRAIDRNKHNQDKSAGDLRAAYDAALLAISRAKTKAGTDKETADLGAGTDSFNRQLGIYNAS